MKDGIAMLTLIVILLAEMLFAFHQRDELKEEAVKRGFAEWVVSSSGTVKWAWREVAK